MISKLRSARRELARKVQQVGWAGAIQHSSSRLLAELWKLASGQTAAADPFDVKYGTDTARMVRAGALDIPDERVQHAIRYEASTPQAFLAAMQELPIAHPDFVFIDIGAGKGRVLLLASVFPFKQIIGVEASPTLTEIAVKNTQVFQDDLQKCRRIDVLCQDATAFQLPRENLVLYFYNPFDDFLMGTMLSNLEKSLHDFARKIYLIYNQPDHRKLFDASSYFQTVKSTPAYVLYESTVG